MASPQRFCPLWVMTDKTHSEHDESAFGPIADGERRNRKC
jgi:hypothetical protein